MAGLTADWSADVRRRLCRVAFGQDLPTLETTPVGELLDRIDGDVYQVASELRGSGVRIVQSACLAVLSVLTALVVWWPAGVGMVVLSTLLAVSLRKPTAQIGPARIGEEEAWSDLAAVMEESIHGQDDVRTSLARPYVLRLYAQRPARCWPAAGGCGRMSARVTAVASGATRLAIAVVVVGGGWAYATGRIDGARLTAVWLLALGLRRHRRTRQPDGAGAAVRARRLGPGAAAARLPAGAVRRLGPGRRRPGRARPDLPLPERRARGRRCATSACSFARGRSYALIGRTGSGKSTLAKVLTRAVDVPRGTVFLGGTDLLDLDVEGLRRWIAVVPQRTEILAGTLAENIALFDPDLLAAGGRAPSTSWASPPGWPTCPTAWTPGSATAATCCRPGRSSWSRSPGSWSATRTW